MLSLLFEMHEYMWVDEGGVWVVVHYRFLTLSLSVSAIFCSNLIDRSSNSNEYSVSSPFSA